MKSHLPDKAEYIEPTVTKIEKDLNIAIVRFKDNNKKDQAVIVIHINDNHFVAIHIAKKNKDFSIIYFDPIVNKESSSPFHPIPENIDNILRDNFPNSSITPITTAIQTYTKLDDEKIMIDNNHCGAFVACIMSGIVEERIKLDPEMKGELLIGVDGDEIFGRQWYKIPDLDQSQSDTLGKEIRDYHASYLAKNQAIEEKDQIDILGYLASYITIRNIADKIESNDAADISLNLGHFNIDDEKAAIIANALKKNHTIKDLGLRGNQISYDGAKSFAEMLKENNTLTSINFNENMINDDGAESIANALKFNKSLKDINFGWNYITHRGVEYFESALEENKTINFIGFNWDEQIYKFSEDEDYTKELENRIDSLLQRNQKLSAVSKLENWCTQTIQNEKSHKFSKEDYDELSELVKNFNFEFNPEQKTKFSEAATLIMRNIDSKDLSLKNAADNFLANLSEKDILDPNYVKRGYSLAYRSIYREYNDLFSVTCRKCDQTLLDNIDPETNNTLLMKAIRKNWFEGSKIIAERISTDLLDKKYKTNSNNNNKTALLFIDDSKFEENQKEELRKIINSRNVKPLETISELADALPSSSPNITSHKSSTTTLVSKGGR